jgi:hypothetical protein
MTQGSQEAMALAVVQSCRLTLAHTLCSRKGGCCPGCQVSQITALPAYSRKTKQKGKTFSYKQNEAKWQSLIRKFCQTS